jgi:predicted esterase
MTGKKIKVTKTARYFMSVEPHTGIENVWFVCHGYAQLANYFLKKFEMIADEKTLIVAPEGLHRFYWNGFSGRVVASWMTKEDREDDIADYVNYLNVLYKEIVSQLNQNVRVNLLGFSQGTATVCRWIADKQVKADNLIIWAGGIPDDISQDGLVALSRLNTIVVVGDEDEFIKEEQINSQLKEMNEKGINAELLRFKGKHEIDKEMLIELSRKLSVEKKGL